MNLSELQKYNSHLKIRNITDSSFNKYGITIDFDVNELIDEVNSDEYPQLNGNYYIPSIEKLEQNEKMQFLINKVYGYLDVMAGIVKGDNDVLNGIEYHQCSETIIAITDYVLAVGHRWDIQNGFYDTSYCKIFYVPKGTIVECFATTLHYTPIAVEKAGFKTICLLLRGTGDTLEKGSEGLLKRKNKWYMTHQNNYEKVSAGDFVGLNGEIIKVIK